MEKNFFNSEPLVFAHRGASVEYPENTLPSFKKAVDLGVDVIETDVHFIKDNGFVIVHDAVLDRVSNGSGNVLNYSMDELKQFDAGYYFTDDNGKTYPYRGKGITFLSLDELLEEFPNQRFNIDLKTKNLDQIKYYVDIIKRCKAEQRVLTASEHYKNLRAVRGVLPQIATSLCYREILMFYFLYRSGLLFLNFPINGDALQVPEFYGSFRVVSRAFVKQAHKRRVRVHVWTINNENDMKRLIDMGVDGIMSDNPELLMRVMGK